MQGRSESLTTEIYQQKFVFEQNLTKLQNIYLSKILGYMVFLNPVSNTVAMCGAGVGEWGPYLKWLFSSACLMISQPMIGLLGKIGIHSSEATLP